MKQQETAGSSINIVSISLSILQLLSCSVQLDVSNPEPLLVGCTIAS